MKKGFNHRDVARIYKEEETYIYKPYRVVKMWSGTSAQTLEEILREMFAKGFELKNSVEANHENVFLVFFKG